METHKVMVSFECVGIWGCLLNIRGLLDHINGILSLDRVVS